MKEKKGIITSWKYRQELVQLGTFENAQSEQSFFFAVISSIVEKIKSQFNEVEK